MNTTSEKRVTVKIPEKEHRRFKVFAADQGMTMSELVRKVIGEMTVNTSVTDKAKTVHKRDGSSETFGE